MCACHTGALLAGHLVLSCHAHCAGGALRLVQHGGKKLGGLEITGAQYKELWEAQPQDQRPKKQEDCIIPDTSRGKHQIPGFNLYNAAHQEECCVVMEEKRWDAVRWEGQVISGRF